MHRTAPTSRRARRPDHHPAAALRTQRQPGPRTRLLNRLHVLLRDLIPAGAPQGLPADKAAALLRTVRPATATQACRRDLARDLLGDLRRIDQRLKDNQTQARDALSATGTTFTDIHGVGIAIAAKILGVAVNPKDHQVPGVIVDCRWKTALPRPPIGLLVHLSHG